MARVFVPQKPSRFDKASNLWVPTVDLSAAEKYGVLNVMLPPEANRLHTVPLLAALREKMSEYSREDYFVAMGDPTIIAAAACLAAIKTGGLLRMLKWDRQSSDYIAVEFQI